MPNTTVELTALCSFPNKSGKDAHGQCLVCGKMIGLSQLVMHERTHGTRLAMRARLDAKRAAAACKTPPLGSDSHITK